MALTSYNIVENTTGIIKLQMQGDLDNDPNLIVNNTPLGHTTYEGNSAQTPDIYYYIGATITARPLFTINNSWTRTIINADGANTATFGSNIANPSNIVIQSITPQIASLVGTQSNVIIDGILSFNTTLKGDYQIDLVSFPYIPYTQIIRAI